MNPIMHVFTSRSWNVSVFWSKIALSSSIGNMSFCYMTTQGRIQQYLELGSSFQPHTPYSLDPALADYYICRSLMGKMFYNDNQIQDIVERNFRHQTFTERASKNCMMATSHYKYCRVYNWIKSNYTLIFSRTKLIKENENYLGWK